MATVAEGRSGHAIHDQFVRFGRSWGVYVFFGAVCIVVGIMVLVWPDHTLVALAVLFGLQLIISGLFHLLAAVASIDANAGSRALGPLSGCSDW